jgi:hypothetical protein
VHFFISEMGTYSSKEISAEEERNGIPSRVGAEVKTEDPVYPTYLMVCLSHFGI